MAVTSLTPRAFGCSGSGKITQDAGGSIVELKRYRSTYHAVCDSASDDSSVVFKYLEANKGSVPWYGSTYTLGNGTDSTSVVSDINVEVVDGSDRLFTVEYQFTPTKEDGELPEPQQGTGDGLTLNPMEWLEDIDVYFSSVLVTAETGKFHGFFKSNGEGPTNHPVMNIGQVFPICNSVCVPYDPPLEMEKQIKVIRIARNVPEYDGPFFDQYQGSINTDRVTIDKGFYRFRMVIAPLTGKISIGGSFQRTNGIKYWRQTTTIEVDYENWRRKPLDKGLTYLDVAPSTEVSVSDFFDPDDHNGGSIKKVTDPDGYPIDNPVLLDGVGRKLPLGAEKPYYGYWSTIPEVPWAGLAGRAW